MLNSPMSSPQIMRMLGFLAARAADAKKPNILIIWGDDIGEFNISAYNMGRMGYRTPNIDSIAKEGAIFTDWYGQQSCTAGRARGFAAARPNDRRPAQAARLCDRPVRQESPRRP